MSSEKILDTLTSIDLPTGSLAGGGIIVFLLALKFGKGPFKLAFVVLALGLMAGAVWWHVRQQH